MEDVARVSCWDQTKDTCEMITNSIHIKYSKQKVEVCPRSCTFLCRSVCVCVFVYGDIIVWWPNKMTRPRGQACVFESVGVFVCVFMWSFLAKVYWQVDWSDLSFLNINQPLLFKLINLELIHVIVLLSRLSSKTVQPQEQIGVNVLIALKVIQARLRAPGIEPGTFLLGVKHGRPQQTIRPIIIRSGTRLNRAAGGDKAGCRISQRHIKYFYGSSVKTGRFEYVIKTDQGDTENRI